MASLKLVRLITGRPVAELHIDLWAEGEKRGIETRLIDQRSKVPTVYSEQLDLSRVQEGDVTYREIAGAFSAARVLCEHSQRSKFPNFGISPSPAIVSVGLWNLRLYLSASPKESDLLCIECFMPMEKDGPYFGTIGFCPLEEAERFGRDLTVILDHLNIGFQEDTDAEIGSES